MSFMLWLKRLLCFHDWKCVSDVWTCTAADVLFRCTKCGKEEQL